jgi:catechol 2,3-dioxygenase-like lactoylglutathione lyase family enzyme
MHVNLAVNDLDASIRFYTSLFDSEPDVVKADYAKWMLDDPRVNFAISTRGARKGIDHLGIQVENDSELDEVYGRLKNAAAPVIEEGATTCCYAQSEKSWIFDPEGIAWETFLTRGESPVYGSDTIRDKNTGSTCCTPAHSTEKSRSSCC